MDERVARRDYPDDVFMIGFSDVREQDGTEQVRLPNPFVDYMDDNLDFIEGGYSTELFNDVVVVYRARDNNDDPRQLIEENGGYWVEVDEETDLNNEENMPVVLLGCGELWIVGHDDLWQQLAEMTR